MSHDFPVAIAEGARLCGLELHFLGPEARETDSS